MAETLSESQIIGRGELASAFALGPGEVVKLYRAEGSAEMQRGLVRLHKEELRAYELALGDPALATHVARCYGATQPERIVDAAGLDVSSNYLLSLGVRLERLEGEHAKPFSLSQGKGYPHLLRLLDLFWERGIYAQDASVFDAENERGCKFIDITTRAGNSIFCALIIAESQSHPAT